MILPSTHARLVAQGATIFRVRIDAFRIVGIDNPAQEEHFATRQAAERRAEPYVGLTDVNITEVSAASYNPFAQL